MNIERMYMAVVGLGVLLAVPAAWSQVDPNGAGGSGPYSQQTGMNQNGAAGMTPQNGQPGTPGMTTAQPNQPSSMRDSLGAPGQTGQEMRDKQFMRTAAEGDIAEVKLGTLATEKGSPAVKQLAQKIVDDHTAMDKEMDAVADSLGVMLPKKMSKDQQKEYDKLNGLSGKDFDTEYVSFLVKAHFEDLHAFHMEASVAASPELAQQVVKDMGMMHDHIGLIMQVAKDENIPLPPRPQRPPAATRASK